MALGSGSLPERRAARSAAASGAGPRRQPLACFLGHRAGCEVPSVALGSGILAGTTDRAVSRDLRRPGAEAGGHRQSMVVTALLLQPGFDERGIETFQPLFKGEPAQPLLGGESAQPILFHHAIEERLQVLRIAQDVFQ